MGGKRVEPTGRYVVEDHPSIKGLVCVYWQAEGRLHRDPRPLITLGAPAVPLLAEALADYELEHQVAPAPSQVPKQARGRLRAVNDDGVV
jgi:hypothetical protein